MFKRSKNIQVDMFKDISNQLSKRKQKLLGSVSSWHNVMWREVVSQIDEHPYSVLYDDQTGRPNAPIRVLIGMMILKEGNGWSDEQLYEACRFNIKVMHSLGLRHMDDDVPVESTYYEFRRLLGGYLELKGEDLLKETFLQITRGQVSKYGVSGRKIRLDSKLINSNIAKSNRLQLIVETLRNYIKPISLEIYRGDFNESAFSFFEDLQQKSTSNIIYPLNKDQKDQLLHQMGPIIGDLLEISTSQSKAYKILKQVYEEQYEQSTESDQGKGVKPQGGELGSKDKIKPRPAKQISSDSIQSAHDTQARYRTKGQGASKQTVAGYHANVTESCEKEDGLNLILDVEVVEANVSEDTFLLPSIENSQKVLDQSELNRIKEAIADGGYDSIENRKEMLKDHMPRLSIAKMKGRKHRYKMEYDEGQNLQVKENEDGSDCEVSYSNRAQKYAIKSKKGDVRYMTQEEIDNYIIHEQIISQVNEQSYNLRATVESTIHQVFHRLKKRNKMVYRGKTRCQWYVLSRAFWVNLTRISQKELENAFILSILVLRAIITGQRVKMPDLLDIINLEKIKQS